MSHDRAQRNQRASWTEAISIYLGTRDRLLRCSGPEANGNLNCWFCIRKQHEHKMMFITTAIDWKLFSNRWGGVCLWSFALQPADGNSSTFAKVLWSFEIFLLIFRGNSYNCVNLNSRSEKSNWKWIGNLIKDLYWRFFNWQFFSVKLLQ